MMMRETKRQEKRKDFSLISKLMATENINVRFDYTKTAYFDLENRDLVLPIFRDLSDAVYGMMVCHETSHALNTPKDGWRELVGEDNVKKQYANILEDARIERLIKRRYPGVVREMKAGYDEIHRRNFFGLEKNENLSERPLIDRLNLYFKSYGNLDVPFTADELEWVSKTSKTETWEDVVALTEELYKAESQNEQPQPGDGEDGDGTQDFDESESDGQESGESNDDSFDYHDGTDDDSDGDAEGSETEDSDETDGNADDGETEDSDSTDDATGRENETEETDVAEGNDGETKDGSAQDNGENEAPQNENASEGVDDDEGSMDQAPEADSQKNFEEALQKSAQDEKNGHSLAHITLHCDELEEKWRDYIVPAKDFVTHYRNQLKNSHRNDETMILGYYKKLAKKNSKVINHMLKEFDMKKAAAEHKRTMTSKTGAIDMDRLHNYKTSDDIFLRNETVPEGKNHGVVMYVDFSGSMGGENIGNSLAQIFNMVSFATKAGIPYRVFGFTNSSWFRNHINDGYGLAEETNNSTFDSMFYTGGFTLLEIVSSEMKKKDWLFAMGLIAGSVLDFTENRAPRNRYNNYVHYYDFTSNILGGTPLNGALYVAPNLINDFRRAYGVDKAIFMVYTDGGAGDRFTTKRQKEVEDYYSHSTLVRTVTEDSEYAERFVEPITKTVFPADKVRSARGQKTQAALMERIRLLTGAETMGFDIYARKDYIRVASVVNAFQGKDRYYYMPSQELEKIKAAWKDNGFYHLTDVFGFDSFTMVAGDASVEDATIESEIKGGDVDGASARAIQGAFLRANRKTNDSRYLTKKLMEVIA